MWSQVAACLLALIALGDAAVSPHVIKRAETVNIYAYGNGLAGYPLYIGPNGKSYISNSSVGLNSITWSIDPTGARPWNVTNTNTTEEQSSFYIITDTATYEQAGFVNSSSTAPSGAVTKGFVTYGPYIMYLSNNTYVSEFWAKETNTSGLWALMWNQDGRAQTDSAPVTLKTTAPVNS